MPPQPLRVTWELQTPAGLAATWALFSDTERYNRAAGFGFRFEDQPLPDGTSRRTGTARFLGMTMRWEERPFQYRNLQWYRWERLFEGSPAERMTGTLRLKPQGDGCAILYTIEVYPRSVVYQPAVAFELYLRARPTIDRVLQDMLKLLADGGDALEPPPEALSPEAARRLAEIAARLPDADFRRALVQTIERAPLSDQDRILPLRLARAHQLSTEQAVSGCLAAVREGALTLSWELLCPLCLSPKSAVEQLGGQGVVHCPSCNIAYDGTFADAVGVSFRTSPALRTFEVTTACAGSPARQPHIVAQDRVEPGASLSLEVALEPGLYRLRTSPPRDSFSVSVGEDGPDGVEIPLGGDATLSGRLELKRGPGRVTVLNHGRLPLQVMLERRSLPRDVLTAGQLLEHPGAAALLPPTAIDPRVRTQTARRAVLALEMPDQKQERLLQLRERLSPFGLLACHAREGQLVATFATATDALGAARSLTGRVRCRLALGVGPVLEVTLPSGAVAPMGRTVDRALVALWGALPERPAFDAELADDPDLQSGLAALGMSLDRAGLPVAAGERVHRVLLGPAMVT